MKNTFLGVFTLLSALILCSCGGDGATVGGKATFSGTIENANNLTLYFDRYNLTSASHIISSQMIGKENSFSIDIPEGFEEGVYRLRIGKTRIYLPVSGDEKSISINASLKNLDKYNFSVTGSDTANKYVDAMKKWKTGGMTAPMVEEKLNGLNPISAMVAAVNIGGTNKAFLKLHESIYNRLNTADATSSYTRDYSSYIQAIKNPPAPQQARPKPAPPKSKVNVGDDAPNIALKDPDGKSYSLSELKGKVVLLDFWASWCRPCRRENPAVVEIYNKYKSQGFTVFSVSLDGSTDRWKNAIQQDKLAWPYHVSDLQKWRSAPAKLYGVSSIPKTFMIDKDGKIASVGLRGAANIEKALLEIL